MNNLGFPRIEYNKYENFKFYIDQLNKKDCGMSKQGRTNELTRSASIMLEGYYAIIKDVCEHGTIHPDYLEEKITLIQRGLNDLNNLYSMLSEGDDE